MMDEVTDSAFIGYFWGLIEACNWIVVLPLCFVLFRQSTSTILNGPAGFQHAPVTKAFMMLIGFCSMWDMVIMGSSQGLSLHWWKFGLWTLVGRLITYQLYFRGLWRTIVGCLLMYHFRQFERMWGPSKVLSSLSTSPYRLLPPIEAHTFHLLGVHSPPGQ